MIAVSLRRQPASIVAIDGGPPTQLSITLTPSQTHEQATAPARLELEVGETVALVATLLNALGQPVNSAAIEWGSTDDSIVSVAADGRVTAVAAGTAEIFASSDGVFATLPVQVTAPPAPPTPG